MEERRFLAWADNQGGLDGICAHTMVGLGMRKAGKHRDELTSLVEVLGAQYILPHWPLYALARNPRDNAHQ